MPIVKREGMMRWLPAVLVLLSSAGAAQGVPDAEKTRAAFLAQIARPHVPLAPSVTPRPAAAGLVAEHITFAAEASERVPALLLKRDRPGGRRPAVIVLHGTGGNKEGQRSRLEALAGSGFVAVAIDGRHHGERAAPSPGLSAYELAILNTFRSGTGRPFLYDTVWDVMRLLDYLATRDDVDASRIGLMGQSKGGMETYLAAAVDTRIAVAVPLIGVQSFRWALDHGAWDSRAWTLRGALEAASKDGGDGVNARFMRKFYDRVAPGLYGEFDGPAMLPLIAPRPLLAVNGDSDPRTPAGGLRECIAAAERAYHAFGAGDRLALLLQANAGHEVTAEGERAALDWFVRWLRPDQTVP